MSVTTDKKPRILLLEDDHEMRAILTQILSYSDYEVVAVETGHEAIAAAREQSFDLVVADVRVEGPDGIEVIEQAQKSQAGIGSLVVSGYASLEETSRAHKLGVGGFLKKPFETSRFLELVRQQLQQTRQLDPLKPAGTQAEVVSRVLQTLVLCLQDPPSLPDPQLVQRVRELAARAGAALELEGPVLQQVTQAAVLELLPEALGEPARQALLDAPLLLPSLSEVLAHRQGDHEPPLEARVVEAVVAEARREIENQGRGLDTEGLDPQVVRVLRQNAPAPSARRSANPSTGLLAIGQALERAGDRPGARASFREYLAHQPDLDGEVEARLGLARLAEAPEDCLQQVELACSLAARIGTYRASLADYHGGLLLRRHHRPEALVLLRRAVPPLMRFGHSEAVALAAVALVAAGEPIDNQRFTQVCRQLLMPSLTRDLEVHGQWLLPDLLEDLKRYPMAGFLGRFCNLFPRLLITHLQAETFTPEQLLFWVQTLVDEGHQVPEPLWRELRASPVSEVRKLAEKLVVRMEDLEGPGMIRIHSFGPFQLSLAGETLPDRAWRTQRTRYLFAYLAYEWGRPVHDEIALEAVWEEARSSDKKGLYWCTSVIRKLFQAAGFRRDPVERQYETLRTNPEIAAWHDVTELARHLKNARQEDCPSDQVARELQAALELYRGPYLEGCYYDWATQRRDHWEREVSTAAMRLAELRLERNEPREAVAAARRALALEPANQEAHLLIMRCLIDSGRPEAAIEQYHECEKALRSLYDSEPSTTVMEYYHRARLALPDESPGLIG